MTKPAPKKRLRQPAKKKAAKKTTKKKVTKKRKHLRRPTVKAKPKAPAKKKPKRRPKKPRALLTKQKYPKTHIVRQQALADYVTDPESHDESHHYFSDDRHYQDHVTLEEFRVWMAEDEWELQRAAYWAEAQRLLLVKTRDQTVNLLADSMTHLNELREYALEWCDPIRDKATGEVLRYPAEDDKGRPHRFAGKPMLAVKPQSFEKAVAAALALDDAVRERRDEVLRLTGQGESASKAPSDPVAALVNLSAGDLRAMAKALTEQRQPELLATPDATEGTASYGEK